MRVRVIYYRVREFIRHLDTWLIGRLMAMLPYKIIVCNADIDGELCRKLQEAHSDSQKVLIMDSRVGCNEPKDFDVLRGEL